MDWIVSLTPDVAADPLKAINMAPKEATVIEVRLDLFPELDLRPLVAASPTPILATLRSTAEGGQGTVDPTERRQILSRAREAGATLIDLELRRDLALSNDLGLQPESFIVSWHDQDATPENLDAVCLELLETPARLVKAIPKANRLTDLHRVLTVAKRHNHKRTERRRLMTFAMGEVGLPSRLLSPLIGPPLGFGAFSADAPAAPGQLPVALMERIVGHLSALPKELYGVVGRNVSRSLSPVMHAAGYRALDLPMLLLPFSVPDPTDLELLFSPNQQLLADLGIKISGWAVTTPYKEQAMLAADQVSPRAQRAKSANTLLLRHGRVLADTTDGDGVVGALAAIGVSPAGNQAVVRGTGGAARSAVVGLVGAGAQVTIQGRDNDRTQSVAPELNAAAASPGTPAPAGSILVNATPLGSSAGDPSPFSDDEIAESRAVIDMVYGSHTTALIQAAREASVAWADGRDVLAHQGYPQFAAFTSTIPPREAMRRALG